MSVFKFSPEEAPASAVGAKVEPRPTLACVGYAVEMSEPKVSNNGQGDYFNTRVKLAPIDGTAGKGNTTNFLFRPEWFGRSFDPAVLADVSTPDRPELVKALKFQYAKNIATKGSKPTVLEGLLATKNNFAAFWKDLRAEESANGEFTIDDAGAKRIWTILKKYVVDAPPIIGYILRQGTEDSGQVDEQGKKIYDLRDSYEVGDYFIVSKESFKALERRRATSGVLHIDGRDVPAFQLAFEPSSVPV